MLCLWSDMRRFPLSRPRRGGSSRNPARSARSRSRRRAAPAHPLLAVARSGRSGGFRSAFRIPRREGERTLFPFDYCGVYNREKFTQAGGFDPGIAKPVLAEARFRLSLLSCGERRCEEPRRSPSSTPALPPEDDATPDKGYKTFFLKNMAVRLRREMGVLPGHRLFDYLVHSDAGPLYSIREFTAVRDWVRTHTFRFRRDPRDLIERWETD